MKKKHTILIVPPRGIPLKSFKIRLPVAIAVLLIALVGLTGFFVPVKTVTNNVTEQNQRKNLKEQNKALLQKIISSLRMLQDVRNQISRLDVKKKQVLTVSGKQTAPADSVIPAVDYRLQSTAEIMSQINRIESLIAPFRAGINDSGNIFDTIPVLYPVAPQSHMSRQFGPAWDPFSGKNRFHRGIDFTAPAGYHVFATASGIVRKVEKHPLWGNRVMIEHSPTFTTVYAHIGSVKVLQGKRVLRGDVIGETGMSGLTSGPHVHYEILRSDKQVDPELYLFPLTFAMAKQ